MEHKKKKSRHRKLRASTLPEMMVVMILTGIVLLSVFDGFSLFETLVRRLSDRLDRSMAQMEGVQRLDRLFSTADSILRQEETLLFYRNGGPGYELTIDDSLLVVSREEIKPDTLLLRISGWRTQTDEERPNRIDSLILVHDTTELRFGTSRSPHRNVVKTIVELEEQYNRED